MQVGSATGVTPASPATVRDEASVAVAAKALKQQKQEGEISNQLIASAAVPPTSGGLVNLYA